MTRSRESHAERQLKRPGRTISGGRCGPRAQCWRAVGTLLLLLLTACTRKAPGPAECRQLATRMVGVREARQLEDPRVRSAVDQITVDCLTTPFDRQLLACVESGADARACVLAFRQRRAAAQLQR